MSDFISNLHINAFRGIKGLTIGNLSTVNVLVGANNSGKTSVLESILFLSSPTDIGKITNMAFQRAPLVRAKRESQLVDFFSTLFHKELDEDVNEPNHFHYSIDLSASVSKNNFLFLVAEQLRMNLIPLAKNLKPFFSQPKFKQTIKNLCTESLEFQRAKLKFSKSNRHLLPFTVPCMLILVSHTIMFVLT